MTTLSVSLPNETISFLNGLPEELRVLIHQAELTWDDLQDLLNSNVRVEAALPWD